MTLKGPADLSALGFTMLASGELQAPAGSTITLARVGRFYQLTIALPAGGKVSAVLADVAVKITRERK